ncbi:hypothetical protein AWB74_06586 [Caballeronia arvi]|uniref:Uncharacterized protein n=1 Tax=Caballeronia arvi TaxID=1777135 RepID=A0A158KQW0_9BURK|nr:hypothetical protein [Caballeronia arvi]SAL83385.1 hypothetical protein AWB74_06586 [Caballeronia arvi]
MKNVEIIQRKGSNFLKLNNEQPQTQYWRGFKHNFATGTECRDKEVLRNDENKNGHFRVAVWGYR